MLLLVLALVIYREHSFTLHLHELTSARLEQVPDMTSTPVALLDRHQKPEDPAVSTNTMHERICISSRDPDTVEPFLARS